jgi:hypothetical protein
MAEIVPSDAHSMITFTFSINRVYLFRFRLPGEGAYFSPISRINRRAIPEPISFEP